MGVFLASFQIGPCSGIDFTEYFNIRQKKTNKARYN